MREVNNSEDVLDSRDVIARRDELKEERDAFEPERLFAADLADAAMAVSDRPPQTWEEACPDDAEELAKLEAFIAEGSSSWEDGETLIRETHFKDYAQELAEECGDIDFRKLSWPLTCIDWEQAARELQYDYTGADFGGVTYYYHA